MKNGATDKMGIDDFLLVQGPEALRALINAAPKFDFIFRAQEVIESDEGERSGLLRTLLQDVCQDGDPIDRGLVKAKLAESKVVSKSDLNQMFKDQVTLPDKSSSETDEVTLTAILPGLVDVVVDGDGKAAFLLKSNGYLQVVHSVECDGKHFVPPPRANIPFLPPRADEVLNHFVSDSDQALYRDIHYYLQDVSVLPEGVPDLLAAFVMHTYSADFDDVQYSPEIAFIGDAERGKSRTAKTAAYMSRRAIVVSDIRDPYLIRFAQEWGGTIAFNVHDIWQSAQKTGATDVLLNRFEKGVKVARVNRPEAGAFLHTDYYEVFGPTLITNNARLHPLLESRSIEITPPTTKRKFSDDPKEVDVLPFKERLTAMRARWLGHPLPILDKPAPGRLGDIYRPLLQVIRVACPEREQVLLDLLKTILAERQAVKSEGEVGQLIEVLVGLAESRDDDSLISIELIAQALEKRGVVDRRGQALSNEVVGNRLKRLGFKRDSQKDRERTSIGDKVSQRRGLRLDRSNLSLIDDLCLKYGVHDDDQEDEQSVTPSRNQGEASEGVASGTVTDAVTVDASQLSLDLSQQSNRTPQILSNNCDSVTVDPVGERQSEHGVSPCCDDKSASTLPSGWEEGDVL